MIQAEVKWENYSVLVVEDEEELRNILCMFFERRKAKVHFAENGEQALAIVHREKIDLVLSDIRMPGTDGVWLLDRLRELDPKIPLVFLATGFADLSEQDAKARGALGLIPKPFSAKTLFAALEEALATHSLNKAG